MPVTSTVATAVPAAPSGQTATAPLSDPLCRWCCFGDSRRRRGAGDTDLESGAWQGRRSTSSQSGRTAARGLCYWKSCNAEGKGHVQYLRLEMSGNTKMCWGGGYNSDLEGLAALPDVSPGGAMNIPVQFGPVDKTPLPAEGQKVQRYCSDRLY